MFVKLVIYMMGCGLPGQSLIHITMLCHCRTMGGMELRAGDGGTSRTGIIKLPLNVKPQPDRNELGTFSVKSQSRGLQKSGCQGKEQVSQTL